MTYIHVLNLKRYTTKKEMQDFFYLSVINLSIITQMYLLHDPTQLNPNGL